MLSRSVRRRLTATQFVRDNRLIVDQLRHFPGTLALVVGFPLLAALFEGFGIGFLLAFMQTLVNPGGEPFHTGLAWFDLNVLGVNQSDLNQLLRVSGLILLTTLLRSACNYGSSVHQRIAQEKLVNRIYKQIFEQLQALSLRFYSQSRAGDIINTLTTETNQLRFSIGALGTMITLGSMTLVYALMALWISWPLTLLATVLLGLVAIPVAGLTRRVRESSFPVSQKRGEFTAMATEMVSGIRTIKAFAAEDFERQRIYRASDEVMETGILLARRGAIISPLTEAAGTTVLIGIIILAMAVFVRNGTLQVAELLTFLFTLFRMVPNLKVLNGTLANLSSFQGSVHHIEQLLRRDDKPYLINGHRPFTGLQRGIELVGVEFGYDPALPILRDINLTIEKGTTVALVGASGAGKSTLADLIPRFYDPTAGQILVDGIDQRQWDVYSLRRRIGIVSQDTFIFNASVFDNIAYGTGGVSRATVRSAADMANALEFVEELPQGFDTILGDRGVRLSGGQRQRIAIARALLREPEILILDEATSALDSVSEQLIQASLERLAVGRTVVAIAHRLSTITNSDQVVVLDQGRLVEQGTYQELIRQPGKLQDFHRMQVKP